MGFDFPRLHAHQYQKEFKQAFTEVLKNGNFLGGPQTTLLEQQLSSFFGRGFIQSLGSGHDSLHLALTALQLSPQDEVIFPVNSYPSVFPLALTPAKLVPVDVDENGQLDPKAVAQALTKNTKVIVMTHLYGLVGKLSDVMKLAKRHNIYLIEDVAQAFGSKYQQKYVGTFGTFGCFSFYPTKNLPTFGDGGAIWTKNKTLFQKIQQLTRYGEVERYKSLQVAGHSRLSELQASVLRVGLKHWDEQVSRRKKVIQWYNSYWQRYHLNRWVDLMNSSKESLPVHHLFVIKTKNRSRLQDFLQTHGVATLIHYPIPVHKVSAFQGHSFSTQHFPVAEHLAESILSLPFHPYQKKSEIAHITKTLHDFYST